MHSESGKTANSVSSAMMPSLVVARKFELSISSNFTDPDILVAKQSTHRIVSQGQSCTLHICEFIFDSMGHPSSPNTPFWQVFSHVWLPPPQVSEHEPKSEHSSRTKRVFQEWLLTGTCVQSGTIRGSACNGTTIHVSTSFHCWYQFLSIRLSMIKCKTDMILVTRTDNLTSLVKAFPQNCLLQPLTRPFQDHKLPISNSRSAIFDTSLLRLSWRY